MFSFKRKNRVITLFLDGTYDDSMRVCHDGKIKGHGGKAKKYRPKAVFDPKRQGRFRKKPKLIIVGNKCQKAYEFSDSEEGLQTHWTEEEAKETVKKETALSLQSLKPIEWNIAIGLYILLVIVLIVGLAIANRIGVF